MTNTTPCIVLVTGSRSVPVTGWEPIVNDALDTVASLGHPYLTIMHGVCPHPGWDSASQEWRASIDMLADEWALQNQMNILRFPADWTGPLGKGAGPDRNRLMVDTYRALIYNGLWTGLILAFHPHLDQSRGTGGTVKYARANHGQSVMHYDGLTMHRLAPTLTP